MERAGFARVRRQLRNLTAETQWQPPLVEKGAQKPQPEAQPIHFNAAVLNNLSSYLQSCGSKMELAANLPSSDELRSMIDSYTFPSATLRDCFGWTLLHHAAHSSSVEGARRLLALRADPNATNCLGRTPLHEAVIQGNCEVVLELLSFGANPNIGDLDGWTPVHFAVHTDSLKSLTALMRFAPDLHALNLSHKTPKDYIRSEAVSHAITNYEQPLDESTDLSRDSVETTDMSPSDGRLLHCETKSDMFKRPSAKERRDPVTVVRAQRPNEESGAIVCPHPNSAYS